VISLGNQSTPEFTRWPRLIRLNLRAPPKFRLFVWLILQNQVWTADRLKKRVAKLRDDVNFANGSPKPQLTYSSSVVTL
jgi:hypothetical protein